MQTAKYVNTGLSKFWMFKASVNGSLVRFYMFMKYFWVLTANQTEFRLRSLFGTFIRLNCLLFA